MTTFAEKLETIFGKGCRIIRRAEFLEEIRYNYGNVGIVGIVRYCKVL